MEIGRELIALAEEQKKSFVLYFDMYPSIRVLPADQKGMLLGAVFEYAQSAAERDITPEEIMARYPDMSQACSMAFRFVAETIRRDTEKWKAKHKRYSEAAKVRWEKGQYAGEGGYGGRGDEKAACMRKYIDQMPKRGKQDGRNDV